jgi:hypothetical protein
VAIPASPGFLQFALSQDLSVPRNLRGNHRLAEDPVAKLRLERVGRHQLDSTSDAIAKFTLQAHEFKQSDGPAEPDEQIDDAVLARLIASERAE